MVQNFLRMCVTEKDLGWEAWLCPWLPMCPWEDYFIFLSLSFLICKIAVLIYLSHRCGGAFQENIGERAFC